MGILISKHTVMISLTEVLVLGKEMLEGFKFWTLQFDMNW